MKAPMTRGIVLAFVLASGIALAQAPANANTARVSDGCAEPVNMPKGTGVKPPRMKHSFDPEYPYSERDEKRRMVVLWLVIGCDGVPQNIKVARSFQPDMDKVAMETVSKWRFSPATKDGKPIAVAINVEVVFKPF